MRVLLVSWEYPPVVVGGLGRHVHHLAVELARTGHEVVVLARQPTGTDAATHPLSARMVDGVFVVAVAEDPPEIEFFADLMAWTLAMGHAMLRAGVALSSGSISLPMEWAAGRDGRHAWRPDVVHAHDWLVAHPAIALAEFYDAPLVSTIHATEAGRHSGWLSHKLNRQVHSVEWWLANDSDALIACSSSMADEVAQLFHTAAPVSVIRNGIDLSEWEFAPRAPRGPAAPRELLYAGRLEWEKGIHDLIAALPSIRRRFPGTTLTVAGEGTKEEWLREVARSKKVARSVKFVGALGHSELVARLRSCDAIVLPSRYEPFGIIALEAAAAGAPIVASTAGGLGEAVVEGETGLSFPPGDVRAISAAVKAALADPAATGRRACAARARLTADFDWATIAGQTAAVYAESKRRVRTPLGRPEIPQRPLPGR